MFRYLVLLVLSPLHSLVLRLLRSDCDREILALRQQVLILRRQLGKRPQLSRGDGLALVLSCIGMKGRQLSDALLIVRPAKGRKEPLQPSAALCPTGLAVASVASWLLHADTRLT